jgi:hypothetical protein
MTRNWKVEKARKGKKSARRALRGKRGEYKEQTGIKTAVDLRKSMITHENPYGKDGNYFGPMKNYKDREKGKKGGGRVKKEEQGRILEKPEGKRVSKKSTQGKERW